MIPFTHQPVKPLLLFETKLLLHAIKWDVANNLIDLDVYLLNVQTCRFSVSWTADITLRIISLNIDMR